MAKKYEDMTTEELLKQHRKLSGTIDKLREEKRAIMAAVSDRATEERIKKLSENLSDKEKARLVQVLRPQGIATKEAVGEPGV